MKCKYFLFVKMKNKILNFISIVNESKLFEHFPSEITDEYRIRFIDCGMENNDYFKLTLFC